MGTRYETKDRVETFWIPYSFNRSTFPFIFYDMVERKDATDAMLSLPPMKTAADSGKLISTEVLQFGVYPSVENGKAYRWHFFLAGDQITLALYNAAIASCKKYSGMNPRVSEPPKDSTPTASSPKPSSASVAFDWEEKVDMLKAMKARGITVAGTEHLPAQIAIRRHHRAPNKDAAFAFLKAHPVDKPFYYLIVHTPEGVFGRDRDGIFEEQK